MSSSHDEQNRLKDLQNDVEVAAAQAAEAKAAKAAGSKEGEKQTARAQCKAAVRKAHQWLDTDGHEEDERGFNKIVRSLELVRALGCRW